MTSLFKPAQRTQAKLRLAIDGPSGSGKTYSALLISKGLAGGDLSRVAMIDTERGSGSLYADLGAYAVLDFGPPYAVDRYVKAIAAAAAEGFTVIIIDSLTHAWSGEGGVLDYVDAVAKAQTHGNSFAAWKSGAPLQKKLVDAILSSPCHIIATMRSKTEYVIEENEKGKKAPRKVGLAPDQRKDLEFEFTLVLDLSREHIATASKDRTGLFDDRLEIPSEHMGEELAAWLGSAVAVPTPAPVAPIAVSEPVPVVEAAPAVPVAVTPAPNGNGLLTTAEVEHLRAAIYAKGRTDAAVMVVLAERYQIGDGKHLESIPRTELGPLLELIGRISDPEPPARAAAPVVETSAAAPAEPAHVAPQEAAAAPAAALATPEPSEPVADAVRPDGCTLDASFMTCAAIADGEQPQCDECAHFDASWAPVDAATRRDLPAEPEAPRKKGSITKEQLLRVVKQCAELEELGVGRNQWRSLMADKWGVAHRDELVKTTSAVACIDYLARWLVDIKTGVVGPEEMAVAS